MKTLLELGNRYVKKSDWKDFALVKTCLFSLGVIVGQSIPNKKKSVVRNVAEAFFVSTYAVLMYRVLGIVKEMIEEKEGLF